MTEYAILLPGDESSWEQASDQERRTVYAAHERFITLLAERGHQLVGGAELTHSRSARVVRGGLDNVTVTDGPYAETAEQLTGFYLVKTDDLADLQQLCGLIGDGGAVEIRATVEPQQQPNAVPPSGSTP